jgi:hypothetical protein
MANNVLIVPSQSSLQFSGSVSSSVELRAQSDGALHFLGRDGFPLIIAGPLSSDGVTFVSASQTIDGDLAVSGTLGVNSAGSNNVATFTSTDSTAYISFLDSTTTSTAHVIIGATGNTMKLAASTFDLNNGDVILTANGSGLGVTGNATFSNNVTAGRSFIVDIGGFTATTAGQGTMYSDAVNGVQLHGSGSTNDLRLLNNQGTQVLRIPTGTTDSVFAGQITGSANFTLQGSTNPTVNLNTNSAGSGFPAINFTENGVNKWGWRYSAPSDYMYLYNTVAGEVALRFEDADSSATFIDNINTSSSLVGHGTFGRKTTVQAGQVKIDQGTASGDAFMHYRMDGSQQWIHGVDDTDNSFALAYSASNAPVLGTNNVVKFSTAGDATFSGDVTIDSLSSSPLVIQRGGVSDNNVSVKFNQSSQDWYVGASTSGTFGIRVNSSDLSTGLSLGIDTSGNATFAGDVTTNGDLTVNGNIDSSGGNYDLLIPDNSAAAWTVTQGGNAYMRFVTTNASEQITFSKPVVINSSLTTNAQVISGSLTISGSLVVLGETIEAQISELRIEDKLITLASGSVNGASADGGGIEIDRGSDPTVALTWENTNDRFKFNKGLTISGSAYVSGAFNVTGASALGVITIGATGAVSGITTLGVTGIATVNGLVAGSSTGNDRVLVYKSGNTKYGIGVAAATLKLFTADAGTIEFGRVSSTDGTTYTSSSVTVKTGTGAVATGALTVTGAMSATTTISAPRINGSTGTGKLLLYGDSAATIPLTISDTGAVTFAGVVTVDNVISMRLDQTGQTDLTVRNAGTGDAALLLRAGSNWYAGVDNSDSDKFMIGAGLVVGTTPYLTIETTGAATFSSTLASGALTVTGTGFFQNTGSTSVVSVFSTTNVLNEYTTLRFGTVPGSRTKAEIRAVNANTGNAAGGLELYTNNGTALIKQIGLSYNGGISLLYNTTVTGTLEVSSYLQGTTTNGYLDLRGDSGATSGVRIKDDGKVGIGTTSPTEKLSIYNGFILSESNTNSCGLIVKKPNAYSANAFSLTDGTDQVFRVYDAGSANGHVYLGTQTSRNLVVGTDINLGKTLTLSASTVYITSADTPYNTILTATNGAVTVTGTLGVSSRFSAGTGSVHATYTGYIKTASAGSVTADTGADDFVVENSGHTGLSILAPDANRAQIFFGSPTANQGAFVRWVQSDNEFKVATARTGASTILMADFGVTNLTLSGASGNELATFAGQVDISGATSVNADLNVDSHIWVKTGGYRVGANASKYVFQVTDTANLSIYDQGIYYNSTNDSLHIREWSGGANSDITLETGASGVNKLTLKAGGNVLVGTTTDTYGKLQVLGEVMFGDTLDHGFYTSTNTLNGQYNTNADDGFWINYRGYQNGATQFRDLTIGDGKQNVIATFDGSAKALTMASGANLSGSATTTGSFGFSISNKAVVGTTNPEAGYSLTVDGGLYVSSSVGGASVFKVEGTSGSLFEVNDSFDGVLMSVNDSSGVPILSVSSSGYVGINKPNPEFTLDVNGTGRIGGNTQITGSLIVTGSVGVIGPLLVTGTITEQSSRDVKENIFTLSNSLDKVIQLDGVSYNKIGKTETEIGLIAEDVAIIVPEVVMFTKHGKPVGVNYGRLSAILIEAVKELNKKISDQSIFIKEMMEQINQLKK